MASARGGGNAPAEGPGRGAGRTWRALLHGPQLPERSPRLGLVTAAEQIQDPKPWNLEVEGKHVGRFHLEALRQGDEDCQRRESFSGLDHGQVALREVRLVGQLLLGQPGLQPQGREPASEHLGEGRRPHTPGHRVDPRPRSWSTSSHGVNSPRTPMRRAFPGIAALEPCKWRWGMNRVGWLMFALVVMA